MRDGEKFTERLENLASHPLFGVITAVVTVLAGGLASFFTEDIKANFWPIFFGPLSWRASGFWLSVGLAGACLGAGQWAQTRRSGRASNKLEAMVTKLETLPTGDFLPEWKQVCRIAVQDCCASLADTNRTVGQLEQRIRNVLGSIAVIARQYDKAGNTEYCASIMLWRPCDSAHHVTLECRQPFLIVPWFQGDQRAQGVLELIPVLSTVRNDALNAEFVPDPRASALVLPIPKDTTLVYDQHNRSRTPVLPGAAWAFVYKAFAQFVDVREFARWIDDQTSIDAHAAKAMKDYFRENQGKHIQSFGSLPILMQSYSQGGNTQDIGVLNLHSVETGLLADNGQTLFVPLLEPFLVVLAVLLLQREDLLNEWRKVVLRWQSVRSFYAPTFVRQSNKRRGSMSLLLKALLNGGDFKDALAANGKAIQDVAARKTVRSFKVTRNNGFITTEIYPELTQVAVEATAKT